MALIVENGTIVENANSYVDVVYARAYAESRGLALSAVDATLEAQLITAMDYLEALRSQYQGTKLGGLQWPRYGVTIDGVELASDTIPKELKDAQCRLAFEVSSGVDLMPTTFGKFAKKEKVGDLEVEYSEGLSTSQQPSLTVVDNLLAQLMKHASFRLGVVRV